MLDLILTAVVYGLLVLITLDAYFGREVQRSEQGSQQRENRVRIHTPSLHR